MPRGGRPAGGSPGSGCLWPGEAGAGLVGTSAPEDNAGTPEHDVRTFLPLPCQLKGPGV